MYQIEEGELGKQDLPQKCLHSSLVLNTLSSLITEEGDKHFRELSIHNRINFKLIDNILMIRHNITAMKNPSTKLLSAIQISKHTSILGKRGQIILKLEKAEVTQGDPVEEMGATTGEEGATMDTVV
eukprot:TRINITY_DN368_c0_g1_i1.p3 TRINITY_DN368_c0_g1~~TRINITY_DN368_c0_g1_i1.p3  ORF type:complete len:127 (+),score=31.29 TRINITY_DN368_c0_g1_i1:1208-1588(+)